MNNIISTQLITEVVSINPTQISKNIDTTINLILKKKYEGKCQMNGFILKDSIQLVNRSMGEIATFNNEGTIRYNVTYNAQIINPSTGDKLTVVINNINKMGIVAFLKLDSEYTIENTPIMSIIPKDYIDHINNYTIGQQINITVSAVRNKYGGDKIHLVSRINE